VGLKSVVQMCLFCALLLFGISYALFPKLRSAIRARVRRNAGNSAGVDAGVGAVAACALAALAATIAVNFPMGGTSAGFMGLVILSVSGSVVGIGLLCISLYAFLYGRPKWAVRDPRDSWVAESRGGAKKSRKADRP
jgi:ABC-type Fe3+ transport system permease subunit